MFKSCNTDESIFFKFVKVTEVEKCSLYICWMTNNCECVNVKRLILFISP